MRRRFLLPPLLATCLVLSGCGRTVREFLDATYTREGTTGSISVYVSPEPVAVTALRISEATDPLVLADDAGSEYLRYNDEIVIVSPRQPSGSTITLDEDLDNDYRRGKYRHLGYGFDPGSPFKGSGGPGDFK